MEEETNPLRRRAAPKESPAQSSRMENADESSLKRGGGRVLASFVVMALCFSLNHGKNRERKGERERDREREIDR